ncbi:MAG: 50S ribosomal protein L10, partial [Candidatus Omnitrophica bacterium]|nr:50S ribosomal protein L10 [Candidatus Omnitrophota bacterium]
MKKLSLLVKQTSENRIKNILKQSNNLVLVKYSGLSSPDISSLRQSLKTVQATLFVVKNSVARRALKDAGLDTLVTNVDGPCGLVFVNDEPVSASSALCTFAKDHQALVVQAGFLQNKILNAKEIEAIAKLPSKAVLRHQVVIALHAPINGLVISLHQVLKKFVYCLDQVRI